jgi:hypothetical protein
MLAPCHAFLQPALGLYPGWKTSAGSAADLNRMGSFLGAMAQSNGDEGPEQAPPASDLATAEYLGRRVGSLARRWASAQRVADQRVADQREPAPSA